MVTVQAEGFSVFFDNYIIFVTVQFVIGLSSSLPVHGISSTGCHRRNGPNFGRVFLMFNYTDITQNTYIQS